MERTDMVTISTRWYADTNNLLIHVEDDGFVYDSVYSGFTYDEFQQWDAGTDEEKSEIMDRPQFYIGMREVERLPPAQPVKESE